MRNLKQTNAKSGFKLSIIHATFTWFHWILRIQKMPKMAEFASEMPDVPDQKQPVDFEGFSAFVFTETV